MPGLGVEVKGVEQLDALIGRAVELGSAMAGDQLKIVMGTAMRETVQEHFRVISLDAQHHESAQSLGATQTGFYEQARNNTQTPVLKGEGVSVSIDQEGLAQRYFGGDISARPGGFLTIPARAEAYGHRAREFSNLALIKFPSGVYALVDKNEPQHEGTVYFWLVRSVHQQGDPSILPTDAEITDAAAKEGADFLDRFWNRQIAA